MPKVLVTGGAGFIGSHLCKRLIDEGHHVFCIDNLLSGEKTNLVNLQDNPKFQFIQYDVSSPLGDIAERLNGVNYIFHLASPASPNQKSERSFINHPIETLLVNSVGTYNLLKLAAENNSLFLFTSTSEIYGDPSVSPQPESYFGNVNPVGIRSVYDESKRFGEAMTFAFRRKFATNARVVRIFNTYGPLMRKDDGRVVSTFINQALANTSLTVFGNGDQTRSFCYVDDMVEGICRAMFTSGTEGEVINLGNPDERKISEIASLIKDMVSSNYGINTKIVNEPLPEDDPKVRKPDISKAKRLLGWEPRISLQEGLGRTIEYFKSL